MKNPAYTYQNYRRLSDLWGKYEAEIALEVEESAFIRYMVYAVLAQTVPEHQDYSPYIERTLQRMEEASIRKPRRYASLSLSQLHWVR